MCLIPKNILDVKTKFENVYIAKHIRASVQTVKKEF